MNFEQLKKSLLEDDKNAFKGVIKANTHTHGLLSSNNDFFYNEFKKKIVNFKKFYSIQEFNSFVNKNLDEMIKNKDKQFKLYELSIITAINDGINILDMSLDYKTVYKLFNNSVESYIKKIRELKEKYESKLLLNFDLGISRKSYKKQDNLLIKKLIDSGVFNGIDLYGDELAKNIVEFKEIYRYAKKRKLLLKAHVGEFGNAYSIKKAIKVLKLNVVQHGISIVNNKKVMKYAKNKKVLFNVCVSSNILMSRVNNLKNHPIKKMFGFGLLVTLGTDDELIFGRSLFEEYKLLFDNVFSITELYKILNNGFKMYNNFNLEIIKNKKL